MRNGTRLYFSCLIAFSFCVPFSAFAALAPLSIPQFTFDMLPQISGLGTSGIYQSALKVGDKDTFRVNVHSDHGVPTMSGDFSQIGIASPTTTPLSGTNNPYHFYVNGTDYYPDYFFRFGPFTISADVPDGLKTVTVTTTDSAGNATTSSVQIVVDNVPPTISLSDISFSNVSPKKGDTMYLSGTADGTGSALTIYNIRETIWDVKGKPIWGAGFGNNYNGAALTTAIAASTDGSFTRVPYTIIDTAQNDLSTAVTVNIVITAYDASGHVVTTSLTVPVPKPPPPDPCIAADTCVSNVLFLPGIEGSRLYEGIGADCGKPADEKLWEPFDSIFDLLRGAGDEKVKKLFLDSAGKSVCNDIYTKAGDIIDSVGGSNIYKSFIDEMDGLKTDNTIKDWKPVAYDWRLSLDDLLNNGTERNGKIYYEEASSTPYIEQTLRALAASSKTGKVTFVTHSNGGLVAKALLSKPGSDIATLVDKIIMVGAPQSGAPVAVGALLYGYDQGISSHGIPILHSSVARSLAQNSPMAYHLLPSEDYLESTAGDSAHPVARFAGGAYAKEISAYGTTIGNRVELKDFLLAEALNASLIDYANSQHTTLDFWTPPAGIKVSQISGWGADTVSGIDFFTLPAQSGVLASLGPVRAYRPLFTEDGDGTVPVPSALMMAENTDVKRYWLNLFSYNDDTNSNRKHRDLFEIPSLEDFIKNIITNSTSTLPTYISSSQPTTITENKKLTFFLHSPLTLQLTDSSGNVTGLGVDGAITQDIPDSVYGEFGDVKFITVPEGASYQLTMHGEESGIFSLDMQESSGGVVTNTSTIANVPATVNTLVSLSISGGIDTASALTADENGDGTNIITVTFELGETVNYVPPPVVPVTETNVVPEPDTTTSSATGSASHRKSNSSVAATEPVATTTMPIVPSLSTILAPIISNSFSAPAIPVIESDAVPMEDVSDISPEPAPPAERYVPQTASVFDASQQAGFPDLAELLYNGISSGVIPVMVILFGVGFFIFRIYKAYADRDTIHA